MTDEPARAISERCSGLTPNKRATTIVVNGWDERAVDPISLQKITFPTVRDIVALDVNPVQRAYVASNAVSMAEAYCNPGAWCRAICRFRVPVGFVMILVPTRPGAIMRTPMAADQVGLWRLMIDRRFQGNGFGKQALDRVCEHFRAMGSARHLVSSYVAGPDGPERFYRSYGFRPAGALRNRGLETEITLPLGP